MRALLGRLGLVGWLVVVWVALWGDLSVPNVLGGLVLGVLLVRLLPLTDVHETGLVKPFGVLRFLVFFAFDLVRASLQVLSLAVRPRPLRPAIVRVPVRGASDGLLTLLANAISLTPGTLTLEVDRPRQTLYVHVIDVGDGPLAVERVRQAILRVEHLAVLAVGSRDARRTLHEAMDEATEVPQ